MKKLLSMTLLTAAMLSMLTVGAQAADYDFVTDGTPEYYDSTSYEEVYGSQYNYGGPNVVDYQIPELEYGSFSTTLTGIMEKTRLPGLQEYSYTATTTGGGYGVTSDGAVSGITAILPGETGSTTGAILPELSGVTKFTELTDDFLLSNGAIGRISIPAIDVKNFYVWEDTTAASMRKGVGHFTNTSVWEGNVGIAGHNRGAKYVIGAIKDLEPGDKITYKTSVGERTYAVETVTTIKNNDWSYLEATSDNRITLITCVAGDSSRRWVVQAVEVG